MDKSNPSLCVSPKFLKYPDDNPVPELTKIISSKFLVKYPVAFQLISKLFILVFPLNPVSNALVTTCSNGGSATKALGNLHGAAGSAQANSTGDGALLASL